MDERFSGLLPDSAAIHTMTSDAPLSVLTDAERSFIAAAVPVRQGEFAAARVCARRALGDLGVGRPGVRQAGTPGEVAPISLVPGPDRDVSWPVGVLGSITHCPGLRAAAVIPVKQDGGRHAVGIGIDAEPNAAMDLESLDLVTVPAERPMLRELTECNPSVSWDRLLFSAKESVFKTWFPLTRRWLDFTECELEITADPTTRGDSASGSFHGEFLVPGPVIDNRVLAGLDGRWRLAHGHLVTAVCLIVSRD